MAIALQATESQIQTAIMGFLRYKGYYVQRMNSGAMRDQRNHLIRMNRPGTPDIMAFKPCRYNAKSLTRHYHADLLFIEVKRPGNNPTYLQQAVMKELEEHGARCIVAHSVDEVAQALGEGGGDS
jgi:hypothetical protein